MSIQIKTAIHPGIYASQGGGKTHVVAEAKTGPRNLLRLASQLRDSADSATRSYGNIGHCGTWLEIDGVVIDSFDVADLGEADEPLMYERRGTSRTEKAAALIGYVQSGAYAHCRQLAEADASPMISGI